MTEFNITNNTAGVLVLTSLDNFNLGIGQTKDMFAPANGNFAVGDMVQNEELQVLLDATSIGITDEVPNTITNLDVIGNLLTGGGPGIMDAANRAAFTNNVPSIGLDLISKWEPHPQYYMTHFMRLNDLSILKKMFLQYSDKIIISYGGIGTFR